jgi:hypothetical protein
VANIGARLPFGSSPISSSLALAFSSGRCSYGQFTNQVKHKLLQEKGLPDSDAGKFELDHYIPLALGGDPRSMNNLWLQPWEGEQGAKKKDRLERRLQVLVCAGSLTLERAREEISRDWEGAYGRYVTQKARDLQGAP